MIPRRVKFATLLAFCLHGFFILTASYRQSYDAYNHMFFADHYRLGWWSLWEPRWYTGFEVVSYPPLIHQLIALLSNILGVDAGFGLVLWLVLTAYPLAIFLFCRIFTGRSAASYAAIGAALLPSLYLSGHIFGQLPSLAATLLALLGTAVLADYLRNGRALAVVTAICIFSAGMSAHHATLLFWPWLTFALGIRFFSLQHTAWRMIFFRMAVFVCGAILAGYLVVYPFWHWGARQALQTSIDHASRHNFFQDPLAVVLFFLPMYGLLVLLIPYALKLGMRKQFWGAGVAFLFLFLLGLGDTTPLPRLMFGQGWAWLTYDRFSFWASLVLLLFLAIGSVMVRRNLPGLLKSSLAPKQVRQRISMVFFVSMTFIALLVGSISAWLPTQPAPMDMQPVADFLDHADRSYWRYITFGFGDQFAYLSRLTKATTIDGSYHTARTLPELRSSGIGQIDSAYWIPNGLAALDPILQKSGERGVRWGFVNLKYYNPVLVRNGWRPIATLSNGVEVWENPSFTFPQPVASPVAAPITSFAWGVFPLLAFSLSGLLALRLYYPGLSERFLANLEAFAAGLLPLGLVFWYYRRLFAVPHERIYFTYSDPLFFLADGLALIIVFAWLLRKHPQRDPGPFRLRLFFSRIDGWLIALCLLATISTLWSFDWRTSLYVSLHLWLVYGLYRSLSETPSAWRSYALGSGAALLLQAIIGIGQFAAQSTTFTTALKLDWPGSMLPGISGASVVQLADGARWLRAYGTFPHPNLLGGWTLALMAPLLTIALSSSRWRIFSIILFYAGLVLLALTFSRAAWLGLGVFTSLLLFHYRRLERKKLLILFLSSIFCLALLYFPLRSLVLTRLVEPQVQTEKVSSYTRMWLIQRTWEIIKEHPVLGVGIGSYSLALSQHVARFYRIEPVHNLALLAWSELGIAGMISLAGLACVVLFEAVKARRSPAIILSAALAGLLAISFFDHYLWTLAPGRLLFGALLGLWAGQVKNERGG